MIKKPKHIKIENTKIETARSITFTSEGIFFDKELIITNNKTGEQVKVSHIEEAQDD